jgi:branched-chain amino acid transport system permease protein
MTIEKNGDLALILIVTAALAALPLGIGSNTAMNFLTFVMIITLAAQGWNLIGGYGGQFSFGHAAFFGTGAYAMALTQVRLGLNPWAGLPLAVVLGAAVGGMIGFLSFRAGLRGSYFALVTLAFAEVLRVLANSVAFTGGGAGVLIKLQVGAANFQFADKAALYWIALACVAAALLLTRGIERSRFGAHLTAVRENEEAARALGVDAFAVKLQAIMLSGAVTSAAGALYAQKFLYVDSGIAYGSWISVEALLAPIVGGAGTVWGPLLGAFVLLGLGEWTKGLASIPGIDLIVYGVLLIVTIAFAPRGIMGLIADAMRRSRT